MDTEFSEMKLGLLPPTPAKVRLRLGDYLTGVTPAHPTNVDYLSGVQFGLYANDKYGVCGPTSVANSRREITARLKGAMVAPSQDDVFDLYRRSGNSNFDPATGRDDNGVNMQQMLQTVVKSGIAGDKALAFAAVDVDDPEELRAAVANFGFLLYGVILQTAQQTQTQKRVWDYQPSRQWGGHAVLGGAYDDSPRGLEVITWNQRVLMTDSFVEHQLSEAWVVLWPEHLTDRGFLAGVDLQTLAADYEAITGRPFPATVPPKPTPSTATTITLSGPLPAGTYLLTPRS